MEVNVQPKELITTQTISKIKIDEVRVNLNSSAKVTVQLLTSEDNLIGVEFITLDGDDYNNWSNDDQYLVDFALSKLGLSI